MKITNDDSQIAIESLFVKDSASALDSDLCEIANAMVMCSSQGHVSCCGMEVMKKTKVKSHDDYLVIYNLCYILYSLVNR